MTLVSQMVEIAKEASFIKLRLSDFFCKIVPNMNIPLKTKIKYWYYFLRLCHLSQDPTIQSNLKKSEAFYKSWGNYQSGSYERWWKEHSILFNNKSVIKKLLVSEPLDSNYIYFKISRTYSPSTAAKLIKLIYTKEQNKTLLKDGKLKKSYIGSYQLSTTDIQGSQFEYYLKFTKDVYIPLMNKGVNGTKQFRIVAQEVFQKQKIKSFRKKDKIKRQIPFANSSQDKDNLDRLTRRYKTYSKNILLSVSSGVFPGNYEEVGTTSQIKKRKIEKEVSLSRSRGPTQSKFHNKTGLSKDALWSYKRNKLSSAKKAI